MPGLVADSLPDSFGNAVIENWLASIGKSLSDFTAIDRLCYTGKRGMGALEYVPATSDIRDINETINVREMVKFASDILERRESVSLNSSSSRRSSAFVTFSPCESLDAAYSLRTEVFLRCLSFIFTQTEKM